MNAAKTAAQRQARELARPQHTEGPWRVQPYSWQRGNVSVFAPKFGRAPYGACVAHTPCSEGVGGADGALANAHLIAAAPDLLRELEHLVRLLEPCIQDGRASIPGLATFNGPKAAIAKARGACQQWADGCKDLAKTEPACKAP